MKNKSIISIVRSSEFAVWIAILSVIVQSFHSFTAFYNTGALKESAWGIGQAVLFSIVIDLAILFYTVRGRRDVASYAALCMVIINAYYYYQHLGLSFDFGFGIFLSLLIPVSVYFYSEEIKQGEEDPSIADAYTIEALEGQIDRLKIENRELDEHIQGKLDEIAVLNKKFWEQANEITNLRSQLNNRPQDTSLVSVDPPEDEISIAKRHGAVNIPSTDRPIRS